MLIDTNQILDDLEMYNRKIRKLEKISGYKIDDLIYMFKNKTIKITSNDKNDKVNNME